MYGTFWHKINKGGLNDIVKNRRLISTKSRYGGVAVRANPGEYHPERDHGIIFSSRLIGSNKDIIVVEFETYKPPRSGTAPGWAEWLIPEGEFLNIHIKKIYKNGFLFINYLELID